MSLAAITSLTNPLNDPRVWIKTVNYKAPLSDSELALVQAEIDTIIGTTRDNKSIAKVVWNGDTRYWKDYYDDWDEYGRPVGGLKKRPYVLYMSIFDDNDRFIRDTFVPRYLLLTRLEPEQYADTWAYTAFFWDPARKRRVQFRPTEPPKDYFLWFSTIAEHKGGCCQIAAREDVECHGYYAHPRQCLEDLRAVRKTMDASGVENQPFDSPDEVAANVRDNLTNNYAQQAMDKFRLKASFLLDEAPLAFASNKLIEEGASRTKIAAAVKEGFKRGEDALERKLKEKGAI